MSGSLSGLRSVLNAVIQDALGRRWDEPDGIDKALRDLKRGQDASDEPYVPIDAQRSAVRTYWHTGELISLRDTRLVCFGSSVPVEPGGPCVIDDSARFDTLLAGVERYRAVPAQFRRCYQGLLSGYFSYDPYRIDADSTGVSNWKRLRHYLDRAVDDTVGGRRTPEWCQVLQSHSNLFTDSPTIRYGSRLLVGDSAEVDVLRGILGIGDASWFMQRLYLSQIEAAYAYNDDDFIAILDRLLELLNENPAVANDGLVLLLNRYARIKFPALHAGLRDAAVGRWGNPWIPSNSYRWGRVRDRARELVADWLKLEFIDTFFTVLADERAGDQRRLKFWRQYVHAIKVVRFALGSQTMGSRRADLKALRQKAAGLITELVDARDGNAFIMTMGSLVIVELSGHSNACYGYSTRRPLPFDPNNPVRHGVDYPNSLKCSSRDVYLRHQDDIRGYLRWEERFAEVLRSEYGINPSKEESLRVPPSVMPSSHGSESGSRGAAVRMGVAESSVARPAGVTVVPSPSSEGWSNVGYTRARLDAFAAEAGLVVVDMTEKGGNLWVRTDTHDRAITSVLDAWGFRFKDGNKGWFKAA